MSVETTTTPPPAADADPAPDTAVLRRFNRAWTQRIGALDETFLDLGRPLGASRLIYEIGTTRASVAELRARLGLDSGYLSRLLRGLEASGLVQVEPDPEDGRRRLVRLSAAGRAAYDELEHRSEDRARSLVVALTGRQRTRLREALATADLLVRVATVELHAVPPDDPAARTAVDRYHAELDDRFPDGFVPSATSLAAGTFVVATSDGEPVACGGVQPLGRRTGEIKRMWVHPDWRGAGLGSRMLRHLEDVSREAGHTRVVLDTNDHLLEALALYERAGYVAVEAYNDNPYARHWFTKLL